MKKKQTGITVCLIAVACLFEYCSKTDTLTKGTTTGIASPELPAIVFNYSSLPFPIHILPALTIQDNTPAGNPITNDGATLGRVLFYDKNLSKNNTVSCGSCHRQDLSFSDSAVKSKGFLNGSTDRHSMALLNLRFYRSGKMFWDERAASLEEQVLQPIQNVTEMGLTLAEMETRVVGLKYYSSLFQKAFGSTEVNSDRISKALSQFLRSIVTYQSRYDQVKQGQATFTTDERDGEDIFLNRGNITCGACHAPPMFITSNPQAPFGLPDPADQGINNQRRFKSGSLRNIANTAPYFHNGSIPNLQSMLNGGIPQHTVPPQDRQKLLAFLQTLTDQSIANDVKYSDPFKQ